jgi:ribosomal protein L11 methyltransferase
MQLSAVAPGEYAEALVHLFSRNCDARVAVELPGGFNPDEGETAPTGGSVRVIGWLPVDSTWRSRREMIDIGLRLISHLSPLPPLEETEVSEGLWLKQEFAPIRVGRRLVITPPGQGSAARPGDIAIPLEPGIAFGTGHHPTTRMCLTSVENLVSAGSSFLDVGTGTGILSIAALRLGAGRAVCLDIEPDAVDAARANLQKAGVGAHAQVLAGTLPHPGVPEGAFNLTAANISANAIISLAPHLLRTLAPGGTLIASGILEDRGGEVEDALRDSGGRILAKGQSGEWLAYEAGHA